MQIVTQDRKVKLQGLDIAEIYTLTNIQEQTFKIKARLKSDEIILLGEYTTQKDMEHYFRIAQYEFYYDNAETTVYM